MIEMYYNFRIKIKLHWCHRYGFNISHLIIDVIVRTFRCIQAKNWILRIAMQYFFVRIHFWIA